MLTDEMAAIIKAYTIGCVASVRRDDSAAVSPKVDSSNLAFDNIGSPGELRKVL